MTVFSGTVLGQSFEREEADNISNLVSRMLPGRDVSLTIYVQTPLPIHGSNAPNWVKLGLVSCSYNAESQVIFDHYMEEYGLGANGTPVSCIIRLSMDPDPVTDRGYDKNYLSDRPELPVHPGDELPPWYTYKFHCAIANLNEPFTNKSIDESSRATLYPLDFVCEILLVDMDELIAHAKKQIQDKLDLSEMCIEYRVFSQDFDIPHYDASQSLFPRHWAHDVFPRSVELQEMYAEAYGEHNLVDFMRKGQVEYFHIMLDSTFQAVESWVADLENVEEKRNMLEQSFDAEAAVPFMSPAYFTIPQMNYLADIWVPSEARKTLRESLIEIAETRGVPEGSAVFDRSLASSLASHLKMVFDLKPSADFEQEKENVGY